MSDTAIVHCNRRFTVLKRSRFFPLDCVAFEQTATLLHCRNRVETYWVLRTALNAAIVDGSIREEAAPND